MLRAVVILILLVTGGNVNAAEPISGNEIYESCCTNKAFLDGYVSGVYDKAVLDASVLTSLYLRMLPKDQPPDSDVRTLNFFRGQLSGYCAPKGATINQATDIFCKYLHDMPSDRQESAAHLLVKALKAAWPCN